MRWRPRRTSAGGLVVGPEPSKLMARVQIPAGALLAVVRRPTSHSLRSRDSRPAHFLPSEARRKSLRQGFEPYQSRAGERSERARLIPVQIPAGALLVVVRCPTSHSLRRRRTFCRAKRCESRYGRDRIEEQTAIGSKGSARPTTAGSRTASVHHSRSFHSSNVERVFTRICIIHITLYVVNEPLCLQEKVL